jgi:hypothetical protein
MNRLRGVSTPSASAPGANDETIVHGGRAAAEPEAAWMGSEEGPAWLRDEPPPPADAPRSASAAQDDDLPDWLANLRSGAGTPAAPRQPPAAPSEAPRHAVDDTPGWLKDDAPPPAPRPTLAQRPRKKMTDWMNSLSSGRSVPPAEPAPSEPTAPEPPPAAADEAEPKSGPAIRGTGRLSNPFKPRKKMTDWMRPAMSGTPPPAAPAQAAGLPPAAASGAEAPDAPAGGPPGGVQPGDETLVPRSRPRKKMTDWLTPAEGGLPTPLPTPKPAEPEPEPQADLPDWLKAMQPAEEVPEWLRDVASAPRVFSRPAIPTETPPPADEAPVADDLGLPDWLKEAQPKVESFPPAEAAPPAEPEAAAPLVEPAAEADLPDWLKALRASPEAPAAEAEAAFAPAPGEPEVPAWLKGLAGEAPPVPTQAAVAAIETPAPVAPEAPAAEAPAAEAALPEAAETAAPEAAEASLPVAPTEVPAMPAAEPAPEITPEAPAAEASWPWLQPQAEAEPEPEPEAPAAQPGDYELPDWLRPSPEAMAETEAELAAEPPVDAAALHAAELAAAEEALPDWLRNLTPAAEEVLAEAPLPASPQTDVPEWLRPAETPPSPPEPPDEVETIAPADVPDWLQTLQGQAASPTLPTSEQAADLPPLDEETLAWLAAAKSEQPAPPAADTTAVAMPDWLEPFKSASEAPPPVAAMDAVPADEGVPAAEPTAVEDMPDWLRALRGMPTQEQQPAEAMPDWLRALRGIPPAPVTDVAAPVEAADEEEGEEAAAPRAAEAGEAEPAPDEEAEGALPSWLAAMRPADVAHPADAEVDAYEENVGVLAGMRGVLRAEPTVAQPHKSTTPLPKLVVGDNQAKHAKMLAGLLAAEEAARPQAARPGRLAYYLERWLVFLALALAILVPQFLLPGTFADPVAMSADTRHAFEVVSRAPVNQPALIAFDYDPSLQGELGSGAVAIITHLMSRGVPVVAVSTRPQGAASAQIVLDEVAAALAVRAGVGYTYGSQYFNLGFIPGGPVGLLQFAAAPQSVFAADFTGVGPASAVWTTPILRGVERLDDFGLIVLVTTNPDDTRTWIEQSQNYAAGIPKLAVVSASAEPMVRPYIEGDAPQLDGLVAGLVGAAQYEQRAGLPGVALRHWSALGGGLWAAVLLIAGGNAVYATASVIRRRRR